MPYRSRLPRLAFAFATGLLLLVPGIAQGAVKANLRVEGPGVTLDPGTNYRTGTVDVQKGKSSDCSRTDRTATVAGPTALGIVQSAIDSGGRSSDRLRPLRVQSFASVPGSLFTCRIGDFTNALDFSSVWLYRVNHVSPEIGADQYAIQPGDQVLWFLADFGAGVNTGDELGLRAPADAHPGVPFDVKVVAFDAAGHRSPEAGAEVTGGDAPVATDAQGRAEVTVGDAGKATLKAAEGSDIPSNRAKVTVR